MNNTNAIRRWAVSYRGHFDGADAMECWAHALADYQNFAGEAADLEFFRATLERHGLSPICIRNARNGNPPLYRLKTTEDGIGNADNRAALRRLR